MTMRDQIVVSPTIHERLGETVPEILASLWPVDCQRCNRGLSSGLGPVALSVDDMLGFLTASLYHESCRRSEFNDSRGINASSAATLTHRTNCALIPMQQGNDQPVLKAFVMLNPGLEQVFVYEDETKGRWAVQPNGGFKDAGLTTPPYQFDQPLPRVKAQLKGKRLTFWAGALGPYEVQLLDQARELILADGGFTLAVTHAIDPHSIGKIERIVPVMRGDRSLLGWVAVN